MRTALAAVVTVPGLPLNDAMKIAATGDGLWRWWFQYRVNAGIPCGMVELSRTQTVEELIATVAFYGMAEIPADLLECLEEIAADLAKDDGTWRVRWVFPHRPMRLAG